MMIPMLRMSHRNDEAKAATPVCTHSSLRRTASASCLIGAVDGCGNLNQIDEQVRDIPDHFLVVSFQLKGDVQCSAAQTQAKPQRRISAGPLCSATENETLRH